MSARAVAGVLAGFLAGLVTGSLACTRPGTRVESSGASRPGSAARRSAASGSADGGHVAMQHDSRADFALHEMAHVRELALLRDVGSEVVTRAELMRALEAHVAREVPRTEIESESTFLKTLGVLSDRDDYERDVYGLIRRTAGGMYLPERNAMLLPQGLGDHELATSLAHEAVHALEDQHFGLEAFERYLPGASDTMLARSCLAEGDATSATEEEPGDVDGGYVERELAAPYVVGTAFVRALRARGGWAEVDRAWRRGGLTTEQVLHLDKWVSGEGALPVTEPTFATLGAGFVRAAADTHGELGVRLVLEAGVSRARAAAGAAGWGGDASVLATSGAGAALAWRIRYDDEASARRGGGVVREAFTGGRRCSDARGRATAATGKERDVLLLVGPPGSTCALLEAWSKEVFAR